MQYVIVTVITQLEDLQLIGRLELNNASASLLLYSDEPSPPLVYIVAVRKRSPPSFSPSSVLQKTTSTVCQPPDFTANRVTSPRELEFVAVFWCNCKLTEVVTVRIQLHSKPLANNAL